MLLDQSNINIHVEWYKNPWTYSVKEISVQSMHQKSSTFNTEFETGLM
jgi:hypothetical protein